MVSQAPGFRSVGLRAGTRYRLEADGPASEPRVLDHDIEVTVVGLAFNPGEFGVYDMDGGTTILVRFEDEVRG